MTLRISHELRQALREFPDGVLELEDDQTHAVYVLLSREHFRRLVYDDTELTPEEMIAAASWALDGPDGWGAPGMEQYDAEQS